MRSAPVQATCKVFNEECRKRGVTLPAEGFTLSYATTIPRQTGLSGSSAIICAAFNCLLQWYGLEDEFPAPQRPGIILSVETQELGLTAGLMDRVAQVSSPSLVFWSACVGGVCPARVVGNVSAGSHARPAGPA